MVVALLAGCSSYKPPTLAVTGASVAQESPDGLVLRFTLDATNENEVELPLREVAYAVRLDGREVFRGVRSPEATLRRLGTQQIVVPAAVPADGERPRGVARFEIDGKLSYTTPGSIAQVLFDTGVRRPSVRFRQEGEVDLSAAGSTEPPPPEPASPGPGGG